MILLIITVTKKECVVFIDNRLYLGFTILKMKGRNDKFMIQYKNHLFYYKAEEGTWGVVTVTPEYLRSLPFYRLGNCDRNCFDKFRDIFFDKIRSLEIEILDYDVE